MKQTMEVESVNVLIHPFIQVIVISMTWFKI